MPVFRRDDVDLFYEVRGSGKPLLLLAGLAADSSFWVAAVNAPALVLAGTDDQLFPVAGTAAFAQALPHATFAAIDGAAHSIPNEFPQAFTRSVLNFLATLPAR